MVKTMIKSHYIIPVFVPDLGCPHQCVFCNQKMITGQVSCPTQEEVQLTITDYLGTIPRETGIFKEVAFYGGSFTSVDPLLQKELLTPAYKALKSGAIEGIRVSTRPDSISEETLALLASYGVSIVELGVQSMDDEVLCRSGRGHTSRDVLRAAALIKSWGIDLGFQMMIGLPGDTEEKDIFTASELISMKPDLVRIYPCLVLKNTRLADLHQNGDYIPLNLEQAVVCCKRLLLMFENAGINVIRIGLQPSEQINLQGDVLAGPYHPAFRELVETAAARDQVELLLKKAGVKSAKLIEIAVPEQDISITRGHKGSNIEYFSRNHGVTDFVTVTAPELPRGTLKLISVDGREYGFTVSRKELSC